MKINASTPGKTLFSVIFRGHVINILVANLFITFFLGFVGQFSAADASDAINKSNIGALKIKGDKEYGEYLASECTACHQVNGSNKEIPVIAGRTVEDFIISLYSYKLKVRRNPVMEMVAQRLTDEDIAALAAYFSTIK